MTIINKINNENLTKKISLTAIFIALGVVLSYFNPFAYFEIYGTKINPFAHIINALTGVLIGTIFSCFTALGIAMLRFTLGIGTIHAFHGGISGAIIVGIIANLLKKTKSKYTIISALFEPVGTVFIGGTIGFLIAPIGSSIEGLFIYWGLFAISSIIGSIIGFLILIYLKTIGISWEDFFNLNNLRTKFYEN